MSVIVDNCCLLLSYIISVLSKVIFFIYSTLQSRNILFMMVAVVHVPHEMGSGLLNKSTA